MVGTAVRIENSSRAHAEALGVQLTGFRTELIAHNGSWQLQVDLGELEPLLVQLFQTLGEWLEDMKVDSLLLYFDDRQYTLLRPRKDRSVDSSAFLLERVAQLETALESRILIEQAKGIVARATGVDVADAFDLIRGAARARRVELRSVAAAIVAAPAEAESQLRRG